MRPRASLHSERRQGRGGRAAQGRVLGEGMGQGCLWGLGHPLRQNWNPRCRRGESWEWRKENRESGLGAGWGGGRLGWGVH